MNEIITSFQRYLVLERNNTEPEARLKAEAVQQFINFCLLEDIETIQILGIKQFNNEQPE